MVATDRYGRSLTRLLHELRWAISERDAYNELCRVALETSWGFFSYASIALKNDMYAHAIKVLDLHGDTSSFWYVHRCKKKDVENALRKEHVSITEIQELADKMKLVRDKTHFHIDKKGVFPPPRKSGRSGQHRRSRPQITTQHRTHSRATEMRQRRTYGNGVSIYWDTETREMGIDANKRGHRYLKKRAAAGKTVDEFCRDVLADALQSAGVAVDPESFKTSNPNTVQIKYRATTCSIRLGPSSTIYCFIFA
jgi:hypothetical protein